MQDAWGPQDCEDTFEGVSFTKGYLTITFSQTKDISVEVQDSCPDFPFIYAIPSQVENPEAL